MLIFRKQNITHHQKNTAIQTIFIRGHPRLPATSALEDPSVQAEQNPPNSTVPTSVTIPLPIEPETKDDGTLWDRTYARLRDVKPKVMEEYERILTKTAGIPKGLPLNETMRAVFDNRVGAITSRQWKIRILFRKDQMLATELVDKVVGVVLKFHSIGNTVASLVPVHAGILFADICFLLPVSDLLVLCCGPGN